MIVRYRSIAGDVLPAKIMARREDGTVDIDVMLPSGQDRSLPLTRVPFVEPDDGEPRRCFP